MSNNNNNNINNKKTSGGSKKGKKAKAKDPKHNKDNGSSSSSSSLVPFSLKIALLVAIIAAIISAILPPGKNNDNDNNDNKRQQQQQRGPSSSSSSATTTTTTTTTGTPTKPLFVRTEPLPLLDQLFPYQSLDAAWEEFPLLSTAYACDDDEDACDDYDNGSKIRIDGIHIPTVYRDEDNNNNSGINGNDPVLWLAQDLICRNDLDTILKPTTATTTPLIHGDDYKIVKKVIRDGEEWTGSLPDHLIQTPEQRFTALYEAGFSLIINKLQRRWNKVSNFARRLHLETLSEDVSCNLYMTPPPPPSQEDATVTGQEEERRQAGFESHWDWMDVIVMQVEGDKLWSVANRPKVQLSTFDQKHKPTLDDMDQYSQNRYQEFLLRPGDVLYIPRGFMHNASSIDTTSLHLTFGIEHGCQTTVEALVHQAIEVYEASTSQPGTIAISQRKCFLDNHHDNNNFNNNNNNNHPRDVLFKDLLHYVVSEVARRDELCGSTGKISSCALRRSVPQHLAFSQITMKKKTYYDRDANDEKVNNNNNNINNNRPSDVYIAERIVHDLLKDAFSVIFEYADLEMTARIFEKLQRDSQHTFCHPFLNPMSTIPCLEEVKVFDRAPLIDYARRVATLAMDHSSTVRQQLARHTTFIREGAWEREDAELMSLGPFAG